jgi:hypothetical protein
LNAGDNYRWWVRGVDGSSTNFGDWSAPLNVTVTPLAAPALLGPGGSVTSAEPTFSWNAVAGADHYEVWVNDQTTGQSAVLRGLNVGSTTWAPPTPLAVGHKYRWWARAIDSTGSNHGFWSGYLDFTVSTLAAPVVIGPKGSGAGSEPTFAWSAAVGADHYDLWVNDLTNGQSAVLREQEVIGTSWTSIIPLAAGHSYRWWIRAVDQSGANESTWTSPLDFTVATLL